MNHGTGLSLLVLVVTAGVLFYVAFTDLKHYKVRNEVILVLACLFLLYVFLTDAWVTLAWNAGFALLMFFVLLGFYAWGMMGGGDLKLLVVAFLWVGPFCAVTFAIFLLVFSVIHVTAGKLKLVGTEEREDKRKSIAFAPSIAAALIGVFMVGCINGASVSAIYHELTMEARRLLFFLFPLGPHTG